MQTVGTPTPGCMRARPPSACGPETLERRCRPSACRPSLSECPPRRRHADPGHRNADAGHRVAKPEHRILHADGRRADGRDRITDPGDRFRVVWQRCGGRGRSSTWTWMCAGVRLLPVAARCARPRWYVDWPPSTAPSPRARD